MKHFNLADRNLKIIPKEISKLKASSFSVGYNQLTSLYNSPKNVNDYIWYYANKLFSNDFLSLTFCLSSSEKLVIR